MRAFADGVLRAAARAPRPAARAVRVDLNRASLGELQALPGIGLLRAEAIVLHRVRHGPFASVDQLVAVDGIGPDTVQALRPFVAAGPASASAGVAPR